MFSNHYLCAVQVIVILTIKRCASKMKNLQKEYLRVQNLSEKLGREFLYDEKYKKDREWWLLGSMFNLLRANDRYCDAFALDQENPDFKVKIVSQEKDFNIEICEVLHPERRRGGEESNPFDEGFWLQNVIDREIDIWSTFKSNFQKKLLNDYGKNCSLLIYHNIPVSHISNYGFWANLVCANVQEWISQKLMDLQSSKFDEIFVINSSVNELITIHPVFSVVYSKYEQYFKC